MACQVDEAHQEADQFLMKYVHLESPRQVMIQPKFIDKRTLHVENIFIARVISNAQSTSPL